MKNILSVVVGGCCVMMAYASDVVVPITTNLCVYTDVHVPTNTSHYFATRLSLTIQNGLIVGCDNQGEYDLFNGLTAAESEKKRLFEREVAQKRHAEFEKKLQAIRNGTFKKGDDSAVRVKVDAFLNDYLSASFGDDISKFKPLEKRTSGFERSIQVSKKFHLFETARGTFTEGKLHSVEFYVDIDRKYSRDSVDERFGSILRDFAATVGLEANSFDKEFQVSSPAYGYSFQKIIGFNLKGQRRGVKIFNHTLYRELEKMRNQRIADEQKKKNAEGESLPKE